MIKVNVLEYQPRRCWSLISKKYYWSDNIENQIWAHENVPLKTIVLSLKDAIDIIRRNPGDSKAHRNVFFKFDVNQVPLKQYVELDKWTGIIYVDLDFDKDEKILKLTPEQNKDLYNMLDAVLHKLAPNNYCYIEHSSSGIGVHIIFYFDCEKTIENFNYYAEYVYYLFRNKIDEYIKDFSHIFTDPACLKSTGRSKIFDDVYNRPYQKFYMTSIDYIYHEVNGDCSNIVFEQPIEEEIINEKDIKTNGKIDIKYITSKKQYTTDYYDRLFVLTALKRYVGERETAYKLWYDFCQHLSLYKKYKTKDFINMFEKNWDKIDALKGHLSILKKYGFKVDDSKIYYNLSKNQYLSDVLDDIIENCINGLNMVVADTGVGKNHSYILLNEKYSQPLEYPNHKPILIIEPLNSIVESKYDEYKFRIVIGSKQIGNVNNYEMIITNYNHLVRYTIDGIEVRKDINDFFSKFELVVIDESHIMLKDIFRSDVLIPFMMSLNKITSTKVIIQTATPMFEHSVLDIKRMFYVNKPDLISKKIIFRKQPENFNIQDITCLVDYYIGNHKKVYIYWSNGSLQNMKQFKTLYHNPDKVVIYHKRNRDDFDMNYVTEHHNIENYDIIMSSVYFGVGNDLKDELDDVAVIIIGMNSWQEDIQANGRWRNVKSIETCILLDKYDIELINDNIKFDDRYNKLYWQYNNILLDKYNRDKSVIISGQSYIIKNEKYADILACMKSAIDYSSQFNIKCNEFEKRGYDVRRTIKTLETNNDYINDIKQYKKDLKAIRNKEIQNMLNGVFDYNKINNDTKLERIAKIIKTMRNRDLIKYCDLDKFVYSKIIRYGTFLRYYDKRKFDLQDYAELFSILWVRDHFNKSNNVYEFNYKDDQKIDISYNEYVLMCGYLIWLSYRNTNENKENIHYFYFNKFRSICYDINKIEDKLIEKLIIEHYYDETFDSIKDEFVKQFYNEFFESSNNKPKTINDHISKISLNETTKTKVVEMILEVYADKMKGKIGSPKKKCIITNKIIESRINLLKKYNLKIGQEFESCEDLSLKIGISIQNVSNWMAKGWLQKI